MATEVKPSRRKELERAASTPPSADGHEPQPALREARGKLQITAPALEKIAWIAAREVGGIYPQEAPGRASALSAWLAGRRSGAGEGIRARQRGRHLRVELRMTADYGQHIPTLAEALRRAVAKNLARMTDLEVREIRVRIVDVRLPEETPAQP
ncbi:MAG: Asp23/Gls24 family envelope stress response protein [Chloroflexi bacterium]|nr:MAG: Asp23/Gls24 family envelope stress response protein [Chloroflexota bacterium]